jgi:antagonist of KipI
MEVDMSIQIITPGALTTVQDYGRTGYGEIGLSPSGAVDTAAMERANILIGNEPGEAVLECTLFGPTLHFTWDTVIAITGADMNPKLNDREIPMNAAVSVMAGEDLILGFAVKGCRSYISFSGGLQIEERFGSKSTNLKCAVGGFHGRALKANDELFFVKPARILPAMEKRIYKEPASNDLPGTVRVVMGPQEDYFTQDGIKTFKTGVYKLSNDSNRMACKLTGPVISGKQATDIISDGISLGSVQVSSNGQPMIMLADRQTTGGYAKIATVISTDIPVIAQCKPGDEIRFQSISLEEAHKLYKEQDKNRKKFQKYINRLR